jgi:hypothetical protein
MQSDPSRNYGPPGPGYPAYNTRSRDTVNTGNSSGSEQWHNSTNPTSEESSVERANGVAKPLPGQQYSYNDAYGPGYSDEEYGHSRNNYPPRQASMGQSTPMGYGNNGGGYYSNQQTAAQPPRPPAKENRPAPPPKSTISLNAVPVPGSMQQSQQQQVRASWFKKRFSKGAK